MDARIVHVYLERLSNLLQSEIRRAGADFGLQPVQLAALHYLSICNRFSDTPMGVTEYLGQTKGTVSQTLKVLERKGLLVKEVDREDKRVTHLTLTDAASELLERIIPADNLVTAYQGLNSKMQRNLAGSLQELLAGILQAGGSKPFGVCRTCKYNRKDGVGKFYCELVRAPLQETETRLICREYTAAA